MKIWHTSLVDKFKKTKGNYYSAQDFIIFATKLFSSLTIKNMACARVVNNLICNLLLQVMKWRPSFSTSNILLQSDGLNLKIKQNGFVPSICGLFFNLRNKLAKFPLAISQNSSLLPTLERSATTYPPSRFASGFALTIVGILNLQLGIISCKSCILAPISNNLVRFSYCTEQIKNLIDRRL